MEFAIHESRRLHHDSAGTSTPACGSSRARRVCVGVFVELLGLDEETLTARTLAELEIPQSYRVAEDASSPSRAVSSFDERANKRCCSLQKEAAMQGHAGSAARIWCWVLRASRNLGVGPGASRVSRSFDLTVEKLRDAVPKPPTPQQPQPSADEMKFTASTKLIIEHAIHQAGSGGTIHPKHILLAIGTSQDPIAKYVLAQFRRDDGPGANRSRACGARLWGRPPN